VIKGFKWVRPFMPEAWVDGDTCHGLIDRGDGDLYRPEKGIRIVHATGKVFDAPEMKLEPFRAQAALADALILAAVGIPLVSTCHKRADVYGRPVASLQLKDGRDFADVMVSLGHIKLVH
jgi:endonuclease YncB( thermonuclease family)